MRKIIFLTFSILLLFIGVYHYRSRNEVTLGESNDPLENVHGVIIPHHDLADGLIIDTLQKLKEKNEYKRIFIIGPNHFYPENPTITTTYTLKDYPIEKNLIEELEFSSADTTLNEEIVENEHSIGIPIKYLTEIYPDASFIPIVVSPFFKDDKLKNAAKILSQDAANNLYVLAIDFAHNVGVDEGLKNNKESEDAIKSYNFDKILDFDDKYLDSPVATVLFLKIMKEISVSGWTLLHSTHGSIIDGQPDLNGTSYLIGVFSN